MSVNHRLGRGDVDTPALRAALSAALGVDVHVVLRRPTADDPDGDLQVEDLAGRRLDVDPTVVAAVLAAHVPTRSPAAQALAEFDDARGPAAQLSAVRGWLVRLVADEAAQRRAAAFVRDLPGGGGPRRPPGG